MDIHVQECWSNHEISKISHLWRINEIKLLKSIVLKFKGNQICIEINVLFCS